MDSPRSYNVSKQLLGFDRWKAARGKRQRWTTINNNFNWEKAL
jgi:hypothetical protein